MDGQTFIETMMSPAERNGAAPMNSELAPILRDLLLKQIENEINAAFLFVEAACKASQGQQSAEILASINRSVTTRQQVLSQAGTATVSRVQAVTQRVTDLREAVDSLRNSLIHLEK